MRSLLVVAEHVGPDDAARRRRPRDEAERALCQRIRVSAAIVEEDRGRWMRRAEVGLLQDEQRRARP